MRPEWVAVPSNPRKHRLNLLLVPWPYVVKRDQFLRVSGKISMPPRYGFFEYHRLASGSRPTAKLEQLLQRAANRGFAIDGVALPELSLTLPQYRSVSDAVLSRNSFLIAGVSAPTGPSGETGNYVYFDIPLPNTYHSVKIRQAEHHRWRLDSWQIERYGLEKLLNPSP